MDEAPDLLSDLAIESPDSLYERLRAEPPRRLERLGVYAVARYEDVRRAAMSPELFSSNLVAVLFAGPEGRSLVDLRAQAPAPVDALATADPPVHTRQRRMLTRIFSTHQIASLEPAVREIAHSLVDSFAGDERVDLMARYAVPLPLTVIGRILGFPESDLGDLGRWSDAGMALLSGWNSADAFLDLAREVEGLRGYIAEALAERRNAPRDDLLSRLASAEGEFLSPDEAVAVALQLLIAGNESTASLIGSAVRLLLQHPARLAALRAEPAGLAGFVEETLRLESPFQCHFRVARQDTELGGVPIPAGSRLMLLWGAANRDPVRFDRHDELAPDRVNLKDHLAFGEGIHYCLGAALARLEARVALEALFSRLPRLRLAAGIAPRHQRSVMLRRLTALEVEF